jgi:hypothetical protein
MKHCSLWLIPLVLGIAILTGETSSATTLPQSPGNFYAGDGELKEYDANGALVQTFAGVIGVYDVAISPKTGNLFASNPASNLLFEIDANAGNTLNTIENFLFDGPSNLAFAQNERLYVTNVGSNSVLEVLVESPYLPPLVMRSDIGVGHLTNPAGIAFDSSGNMFVSSGTSDLVVLDSSFGYSGTLNPAGLVDPGGVGIARDGLLYVVSKGTDSVLEVNPNTGAVLRTFGGVDGPLSDPRNLSVEFPGLLLVSDADNGVVAFNLGDGTFQTYQTGGVTGVAAVAPEPCTVALIAVGLGALAYRRRRKN